MWDNHSVYIFNISRLQYEDNRDDKHDGFEILRKIDINNVTNGEQREFENLTDTDIQSPNKVIVEFGSEQDNNQSGGSTPAGSTTTMETDGVDIETDGNSQSRRGRDTGTGFENEQEEIKCITKAVN